MFIPNLGKAERRYINMNSIFRLKKSFVMHKKNFRNLNPVISCESIKKIEEKYNFLLPDEYREFISKIGNGGRLSISEDVSIELTEFSENLSIEHVQEDFAFKNSCTTTDANVIDTFLETENKGYLKIAYSNSCFNENWLLIITGAYRGEIWLMDDYGLLRLPGISFNEWLNLYLSNQLYSKIEKLSAEERAKQESNDPLLTIKENMTHKNCRKIKWNLPISTDEVRIFEQEHGIELPNEYIEFITQIADGCSNFKATNSKQGGVMFQLKDFFSLKRLNEPFLFDENTEEIRSNLFRNYNRQHSIWESELFANASKYENVSDIWAAPEYSMIPGVLPFAIYNDTGIVGMNTQALLVLNGPLKGQIWKATKFNITPDGTQETLYTWMIRMMKFGVI